MNLTIDKIISQHKTKKGWAHQLIVDGDLINVFSYFQVELKEGQQVSINPARDANFFFPKGKESDQISQTIGALI